MTFIHSNCVVLLQTIWANALYWDKNFVIEEKFLIIHNMKKVDLIFLIFSFSLILDVVKFINMYYYGVIVSCHNLLWYIIYFLTLSNLIPLNFSLVFRVNSIFGLSLTIWVGIFTIADCFTDASYVLIWFLFPPRFSSFNKRWKPYK